MEYEDGYPVDEEFAAFESIPLDFYEAARWLIQELPRAAQNMTCFCEIDRWHTITDRPCYLIRFSTGGWSGAESLIGLIERRVDTARLKLKWRRGGHYTFEIPDAFVAQGTEACEGGDGEAGSVHDGPVAEPCAPNPAPENPQ